MTILVTGGAGFIGSNFIYQWFSQSHELLINIDKLSYASNLTNLNDLPSFSNYLFIQEDINHQANIFDILQKYQVRAIIHFAAESHVDRSIESPIDFMNANVMGTFHLLEAAKKHWQTLSDKSAFRFVHISTDEVYGSLESNEKAFDENHQYVPNSPYSASKAASDHFVRAYFHTYGLPVVTTHCSNNYGPYQFPEKLIPKCISRCLTESKIPIYGDGKQIRDWLYVADHCSAILAVLERGRLGEVYNIGGSNEMTNFEVVHQICHLLDQLRPSMRLKNYADLIEFIKDRPGHDRRYAINSSKIMCELNWKPSVSFEQGLAQTIQWYLDNLQWRKELISKQSTEMYL
jgi:dTDP-glucose 4,6-dehydratase